MEYSREKLSVYENCNLLKATVYLSAVGWQFRAITRKREVLLNFKEYPFYVRIFENKEDFFAEFKEERLKGFIRFAFFRTKERAQEYLRCVKENDPNVFAHITEVCDSYMVARQIIGY